MQLFLSSNIQNFKLWLYSGDGKIKTDEHLCLSGYQPINSENKWSVQLKECGGYENEFWDYNAKVLLNVANFIIFNCSHSINLTSNEIFANYWQNMILICTSKNLEISQLILAFYWHPFPRNYDCDELNCQKFAQNCAHMLNTHIYHICHQQ